MPKKTFEIAEQKEISFLTQVKDNQESLLNQIKHGCAIQKPKQVYQDNINKEHGRIEQRTYETFDPLPMLNKWKKDWPYIRQIIRVTRFRQDLSTKKQSLEIHFYICNKNLEAQDYSVYIRNHWHIENKLHNVKDNAFLEDKHTKRCNPFVFSHLIDIALNIMRNNKDQNIRQKLYENTLNFKKMIDKYFINDSIF